ncbi:ClbS/DfsB family four-helix bundle protein [Motilimonas sp. E26]|uniref:ClbS/DfsB family four-helix bundle protein n=1 Tax=Motilimonas sp. E26 TaxID=2865674 RepID=UPI001E28D73B|nr:ClbS/DfsB family four-helix bundle protein [Motilimonas sp. E26]MCE0558522.1 ClbS/DfsB family four-helix bundle protein [Motilimonas sp. E26]
MSSIPQSKDELLLAINGIFTKLMADYRVISAGISRDNGLEGNIKGTQISVCDTVAYLIGWGKLVLKWQRLKSQGLPVDFPETGYKWNQLGLLADHFHQEYRDWQYEDLLNELESTVADVVDLISSLSNAELYEKPWYNQWTLGRMIQFNTSSPMKNIRTKVRRFKKMKGC